MSSVRVKIAFEDTKKKFIDKLFDKHLTFLSGYENALSSKTDSKTDKVDKSLEFTNDNIKNKVLLTDILTNQNIQFPTVKKKINEFRNNYTIIQYICNTDINLYDKIPNEMPNETTNKKDNIRLFEKIKNNKSIAFIENYDNSNVNYDLVYFLKSESPNRTGGDNNQFLLIWNHFIYSILNLNYVKSDRYLNYTYIYILYRIFYYFLNICINLDKNLNKVKYSDLYDEYC